MSGEIMNERILILGGDKRQQYLADILKEKGKDVFHLRFSCDAYELDNILSYSHIILPLPVSKDKETLYSSDNLALRLDDVIGGIKPCHCVFASGLDCRILDYFEDKDIDCCDFMKDKIFKKANAYLTAQGTLRLLLENTEDYIVGKKALIVGFGDVASTLGELLSGLGVEIYITARSLRKLSVAEYSGYKTIKLGEIEDRINNFDYIFGTVPVNILDEPTIKNIRQDSIYTELASYPFNANKTYFQKHNKKYLNGSSLPGRYLPFAAGRIMAEYILSNL
ncbi:MAG: hypothetical protein J6Q79_07065 [Clostridia bacterium]|nr:hypothetical protein [Clostridia bacterium]